jgi:hypothetical protein
MSVGKEFLLLLADENLPRLNGPVTGAAFRVQKSKQLLKRFSVGRIPEEGPVTPHVYQIFVF